MSGGEPLTASQCHPGKVKEVQFEVFKAKQIKQYAVCCISESREYINGRPAPNSLSDLRMGSTDFAFRCETCHMEHPECPGHFGYIELAEPMFNIGLFEYTIQALKCVCKACGALLAGPTDANWSETMRYTGLQRLREMVKMCQNKKKCGVHDVDSQDPNYMLATSKGCGSEQVKVGRRTGDYPKLIVEITENEHKKEWYGEESLSVLDKISDRDAELMGFDPQRCHPRDFLITVLPVPPPQVRPTVSFGTARSSNELTHKLSDILKVNKSLMEKKNSGAGEIVEEREKLQEHVATYFHNTSTYYKPSKQSSTSRQNLKSISERLKGKYGRLRGNLMGKRVNFSARTVITGDPNLDVDEVGVPFSVAMTLTFPEVVNHINRKRLTEIARRNEYPSANAIYPKNGKRKKELDYLKDRSKISLEIGDIVERHVSSGDVVLFNRQPTLHRMSMMGHRVRVLPFNTFRLNLSCTTPYNADFDGDEMNLHVPQSLLTKAELQEMMMVPKNFVSPNKSAPCMGIVQDSLLGCYRITDKETFLDKYFMQNIAMWVDRWELPIPAIVKSTAGPLWTGKQVFSLVIPPEVTHIVPSKGNDDLSREEAIFKESDDYTVIRRGQLLAGLIKKGVVGASPGSLIHIIFNEKGSDEVAKFINGVQRTTAYFLYNRGFSVGIQDAVADKGTLGKINKVLTETRLSVEKIAAKANSGTLARKPGMTLLQSFEANVNSKLNGCRDQAAKEVLGNVKRTNSFKCMIECGSKGSELNICQIAVMVGQQNVNGERIKFFFRRRTLPHFLQDDYGEKSRGMVNHGYIEGLEPFEFFFHTMAGREGLIDTAVKTADTGYLQRKLIKALEDVHASYDGTVRNASRDMVQMIYGEDGLDGARIEGDQTLQLVWKDNEKMRDMYRYEYGEDGSYRETVGGTYVSGDVKKALRSDPQNVEILDSEFKQLMEDRDNVRRWVELEKDVKVGLPVNIERAVRNAQTNFEVGRAHMISNLNPVDVIKRVRRLQEELRQFFPSYNRGPDLQLTNVYNTRRIDSAMKLFCVHLRSILASKRVIKEYKLTDKAFEFLLGEIRHKYLQAVMNPGEMVGAIAAQSCGEPATQMTLNTFHNAGISSKNVTLGVPRLVELLNVSKSQKNNSMDIWFTPDIGRVKDAAKKASMQIEYCTLEMLVQRIQIFYDPKPNETVVEEDRDWVEMFWRPEFHQDLNELTHQLETLSPWLVRIHLNADQAVAKDIKLQQLKKNIEAKHPEYKVEVSHNVNTPQKIIRIRLVKDYGLDTVPMLKREISKMLANLHLIGIPGIKKIFLCNKNVYHADEEGKLQGEKIHYVETEGTSLKGVYRGLFEPAGQVEVSMVDFTKTVSNNIPEMSRILGIEAARKKLHREMYAVYKAYAVVIGYRHFSILIDTMTGRGFLMAVSRVGINKSEAGPIMRCSFEETVKVLMGAAAFSVRDPCKGVSSHLVLGNQARVGTGLFDLILNTATLRRAVDQEKAIRQADDVDVYHGISSVRSVGSVLPEAGAHRTPLHGDKSMYYSVPQAASENLESQLYVSPIPGAEVGRGGDLSVPYSVQSNASVYPIASSSQFPASVDYMGYGDGAGGTVDFASMQQSTAMTASQGMDFQFSPMNPVQSSLYSRAPAAYQPGLSAAYTGDSADHDSATDGSMSHTYVPMSSVTYTPHMSTSRHTTRGDQVRSAHPPSSMPSDNYPSQSYVPGSMEYHPATPAITDVHSLASGDFSPAHEDEPKEN